MSHKKLQALALLVVLMFSGQPTVYAATGDLDSTFADIGRLLELQGDEARTVELTEAGGFFVGSNRISTMFIVPDECSADNISNIRHFASDGSVDPTFAPARVHGVQALTFARQADGRIVGVGRRVWARGSFIGRCFLHVGSLAAFRVNLDGSLDASFGAGGIFEWDSGDLEQRHQARSLLLEANGTIVVAGQMLDPDTGKNHLLAMRLTGDGTLDASFGDGGVYVGPIVAWDYDNSVSLVRAASGGYRIAATAPDGCFIVALNIDGVPDAAFGADGIAAIAGPQGARVICSSLEVKANGQLLVAGAAGKHGFAAQLRANGNRNLSFVADAAIASSLTAVTAITSGQNGNVYVAGVGPKGTSIMRLNATGALDSAFGDGGRTWIDLPSPQEPKQPVHDLALDTDGRLLVAGAGPFVARLVGDAGEESAGVVSLLPGLVTAREADGRAIVHVRRSGGAGGSISVGYETVGIDQAAAGEDFTAKEGTLHWADGDRSLRAIVVAIADNGGTPESPESFRVALNNVQGGAGLGTAAGRVSIQPDGEPGGQIQFLPVYDSDVHRTVNEDGDFVQVWIGRNFYAVGRVCVTVATHAGTAIAGEDFTATESVECWEDGRRDRRIIQIPILQDSLNEGDERFTVVLSNPTGGAIVGAQRLARVKILAN